LRRQGKTSSRLSGEPGEDFDPIDGPLVRGGLEAVELHRGKIDVVAKIDSPAGIERLRWTNEAIHMMPGVEGCDAFGGEVALKLEVATTRAKPDKKRPCEYRLPVALVDFIR
jgi:hypothetical protein